MTSKRRKPIPSAMVRCPGCATLFRCPKEVLSAGNGLVQCGICQQRFQAQAAVVAEPLPVAPPPPAALAPPPSATQAPRADTAAPPAATPGTITTTGTAPPASASPTAQGATTLPGTTTTSAGQGATMPPASATSASTAAPAQGATTATAPGTRPGRLPLAPKPTATATHSTPTATKATAAQATDAPDPGSLSLAQLLKTKVFGPSVAVPTVSLDEPDPPPADPAPAPQPAPDADPGPFSLARLLKRKVFGAPTASDATPTPPPDTRIGTWPALELVPAPPSPPQPDPGALSLPTLLQRAATPAQGAAQGSVRDRPLGDGMGDLAGGEDGLVAAASWPALDRDAQAAPAPWAEPKAASLPHPVSQPPPESRSAPAAGSVSAATAVSAAGPTPAVSAPDPTTAPVAERIPAGDPHLGDPYFGDPGAEEDAEGAPPEEEIPACLAADLQELRRSRAHPLVTFAWGLLALCLLLGLAGQAAWTYRAPLASWLATTPLHENLQDLQTLCAQYGCTLPVRRAPQAVEFIDRSVVAHPRYQGTMLVEGEIHNTAPFPQPYPVLELTFFDAGNHAIGLRRFKPEEYLVPGVDPRQDMAPDGAPVAIRLEIAGDPERAVSFEFRFL